MTPPVDFADDMLSDFLDEASQLVDQLSEDLLELDEAVRHAAPEAPASDAELLNQMFRSAHSMKGLSAMLGLGNMNRLTHRMENVLDAARKDRLSITPAVVEAVFSGIDRLAAMLQQLRDSGNDSCDLSQALAAMEQLTSSDAGDATDPSQDITPPLSASDVESLLETVPVADAAAQAATVESFEEMLAAIGRAAEGDRPSVDVTRPEETATAAAAASCEMVRLEGVVAFAPSPLQAVKALLVHEKLVGAGTLLSCRPGEAEIEQSQGVDELHFVIESSESPESLRRRLFIGGVHSVHVARVAGDALSGGNTVAPLATSVNGRDDLRAWDAVASESVKAGETLRVDVERLDHLLRLAGELSAVQTRTALLSREIGETLPTGDVATWLQRLAIASSRLNSGSVDGVEQASLAGEIALACRELQALSRLPAQLSQLQEAVDRLGRASKSIQQGIMDSRMVPIGPLFRRLKRVARDVTRVNGKEVQLVVRGESTELDKRMIDELVDPLIHLLRNSADHGIESPETRSALGKPREGTITLDTYHRGNAIVIEITDDGQGLNRERILAKALERRIVTPPEAARLSETQIHDLVWKPGFSTADSVTEISGRGVGMDIVRAKIEDLHGSIEINSRAGEGCTFTITLPLTLAVRPSLLFEVNGEVFGLAIESVQEVTALASAESEAPPAIELQDLLTWAGPPEPHAAPSSAAALVVLRSDGGSLRLIADNVLGKQNVVLQSIADCFPALDVVAGATILADGRVALILDAESLLDRWHATQGDLSSTR